MEFINPNKKEPVKFFEDGSDKKVETIYDDPEWRELIDKVKKQSKKDIENNNKPSIFTRVKSKKEETKQPKASPERVEVNIKLSIPSIEWSKVKKLKKKIEFLRHNFLHKVFTKPRTYLVAGVLLIIVGVVLFLVQIKTNKDQPKSVSGNDTQQTSGVAEPVSHDVPFSPVLPTNGIDKEDIAYNPERNFAKFDDKIENTAVTVSQQKLPENFISDPEGQLEKLAKDSGASELIQTGSGMAYIQQSQQGPQTVVFIKFELLIFIRTGNLVSNDAIVSYIDGLN